MTVGNILYEATRRDSVRQIITENVGRFIVKIKKRPERREN